MNYSIPNHRIIAESAHSAYDKAAQYFNIKLRRVPVNKEFKADVKAIRKQINRNTILVCMPILFLVILYAPKVFVVSWPNKNLMILQIVGSAPGYPHGIIDPIEVSH